MKKQFKCGNLLAEFRSLSKTYWNVVDLSRQYDGTKENVVVANVFYNSEDDVKGFYTTDEVCGIPCFYTTKYPNFIEQNQIDLSEIVDKIACSGYVETSILYQQLKNGWFENNDDQKRQVLNVLDYLEEEKGCTVVPHIKTALSLLDVMISKGSNDNAGYIESLFGLIRDLLYDNCGNLTSALIESNLLSNRQAFTHQ